MHNKWGEPTVDVTGAYRLEHRPESVDLMVRGGVCVVVYATV